jgi:hypothetical protein
MSRPLVEMMYIPVTRKYTARRNIFGLNSKDPRLVGRGSLVGYPDSIRITKKTPITENTPEGVSSIFLIRTGLPRYHGDHFTFTVGNFTITARLDTASTENKHSLTDREFRLFKEGTLQESEYPNITIFYTYRLRDGTYVQGSMNSKTTAVDILNSITLVPTQPHIPYRTMTSRSPPKEVDPNNSSKVRNVADPEDDNVLRPLPESDFNTPLTILGEGGPEPPERALSPPINLRKEVFPEGGSTQPFPGFLPYSNIPVIGGVPKPQGGRRSKRLTKRRRNGRKSSRR